MNKELIVLHAYGSKVFVFNVEDVQRLRCDQRIVGALVGTLPRLPLQNTFHGLPLLLMLEEVTLAIEKNMVKVEGWSYVYTPEERLRCAVYNYLWHKGLYITRGSKFGGDFLAYPGDPMRFHSHYIVEAIHRETPLTPIDIIYKGRLSTNVKKTYVLASITKEAEEAKETEEVFSFSWAGF